MGHKVNPIGMRLGIVKPWDAIWYAAPKNFPNTLYADLQARVFLEKELAPAGVSKLLIERTSSNNCRIIAQVARPGVVIGKKGELIEKLGLQTGKIMGVPVHLTIEEVRKPELDAKLVADSIAQQLVRRVMFRRAMKRAVSSAMRLGAKGIKINISGRLGGAEIARSEWSREGRVPLHTFRADIDYGTAEAKTTYGIIGVKVWIFKGEILGNGEQTADQKLEARIQETEAKEQKADKGKGQKPDNKKSRGERKDRKSGGRPQRKEDNK